MVNMVGWSHRDPDYNTDHYGEPQWFIQHRVKPTCEYPQRMFIHTPVAHAVFRDGQHARLFTDHPGDIAVMAHYYLELIGEPEQHPYEFPTETKETS